MTEDISKESAQKESESQPDTQAGNTVRKRLFLTIFIVILMALTAVASVYRQEIYVAVVRTVTNLLSTKVEPGNRIETNSQRQPGDVASQDKKSPESEDVSEPGKMKLEPPSSPALSLAAEVTKSVVEVTKPETAKIESVPSTSLSEAPAGAHLKSEKENHRQTESSTASQPMKTRQDATTQAGEIKQDRSSPLAVSNQPAQKTARAESPDTKAQPASEQFQVPGSLTVRIENYSGSMTKWRLMVILDDSEIMAKSSKTWEPNRFASATGFISRLSSQITPGSKLAVRDFACVAKDDKTKRAPCLSRMLFDWSEAPYSGLKERMKDVKPGGSVNPCAAAAYSMKKDFLVSGAHSPRLLLITAGVAKCDSKEVLKAAGAIGPGAKTPVDVLAVGMNSKKKTAYTNLAKKTGGVFLTLDNPADMESALKKYSKSLHVTSVDKIEIRGEKVLFSANFDEDITLAPGIYTVVLPSVKGLAEFKRSVPNVRIKSGEASLMTVKLSKGKASVKIGPK